MLGQQVVEQVFKPEAIHELAGKHVEHRSANLCNTGRYTQRCNAVCRFVTFEQDSSVEQVFRMGAMHELAGKRVEVKSATPRGSGPVTPNRNLPMGRVWAQRPMAGRGMGLYPGQIPQAGFMGPYGPVG